MCVYSPTGSSSSSSSADNQIICKLMVPTVKYSIINSPETRNIGNSRTMNRHSLLVWRRKMWIRLVVVAAVGVAAAAAVVAVEWAPLIDYVVLIVANFAPNSMERIHFVRLEMVAGIVVAIENNSFGLSLLDTN